jgi:hypothetical protein
MLFYCKAKFGSSNVPSQGSVRTERLEGDEVEAPRLAVPSSMFNLPTTVCDSERVLGMGIQPWFQCHDTNYTTALLYQ